MTRLEELRDELRRLSQLLGPHVNNVRGTRLGKYLSKLEKLCVMPNGHVFNLRNDWHKHAGFLFEASELAYASKILLAGGPNEHMPLFVEAASGPDMYVQEGRDSSRARNLAAELLFAAAFREAEIKVQPGLEPDFLALPSAGLVYVACKRPKSGTTVRDNLLKAYRQIETACTQADRLSKRGIVAIDATRVINPLFSVFAPTSSTAAAQEASKLVRVFMTQHLQGTRLPLYCACVLVRFAFIVVLPETSAFAYASVFSMHTSASPGSLKHKFALQLADEFGNAKHADPNAPAP